jgi:hypothetical protein
LKIIKLAEINIVDRMLIYDVDFHC